MTCRFFLGGRDLEMREIRTLLDRHVSNLIEDKDLAWGARVSAYADEIAASLRRGETPVLVELQDDLPADEFDRARVIMVDHHGPRAGSDVPTSLEQVFDLLRRPKTEWTRRLALIAANDRAHVAGLRQAGATAAEIAATRAEDRAAQGVTQDDEAEAVRAIAARRRNGRLTIVETGGDTSSAIADRILPELGGPGYDRLLVVMPDKLGVFADGPAIQDLAARYRQSWWGGDLPRVGFWGMETGADKSTTVAAIIDGLR